MDLITAAVDLLSTAVLVFLVILGSKSVRAFRQSKQAVVESASLLSVIVTALTSRVEASESLVTDLRSGFQHLANRSADLENEQSELRGGYHQVLEHLQEALLTDRKLILEIEQLKTRLTEFQQQPTETERLPKAGQRTPLPLPAGDILARVTPTERHTLEILFREGPKAAPELGRRMRKSREHMARLMKNLYLEGYVDRESNHAPYKYKLNEKVQSILEPDGKPLTEEQSEKA